MTYSGLLHDKAGNRIVRVRFERRRGRETDFVEGIVPSGKITQSSGFSPEEVRKLSKYMKEHADDIFTKAKSISSIAHLFGD